MKMKRPRGEAVGRRGLAPQDMLSQVDRDKASMVGYLHFRWGPVSLWPDSEGDLLGLPDKSFTQAPPSRMERGNKAETLGNRSKSLRRRNKRPNFWEDEMSTLLGCLDRDLNPFGAALLRIFSHQLDHTTSRRHRTDGGRPQFGGLLHQPVKTIILDQGHQKMDARPRTLLGPLTQNPSAQASLTHRHHSASRGSARPIKNLHLVIRP